ncbi:DUF998 domain-containing protein [Spirillospora sp. CA-255316]
MDLRSRTLLLCGAVAGPLFTLTYLVEGATRAHYDPLRHAVSSLALGEHGWTQIANFLVAGTLTVAFAAGLRTASYPSRWGPALIGVWGLGLLGAGVFVADPIGGYPLGTPERIPVPTMPGLLHDLISMVGFAALAIACLVMARRGPVAWRVYSVLSGLGFAAVMVASTVAFEQNGDLGGLLQRIAVTIGWTWTTLLAVCLLRRP